MSGAGSNEDKKGKRKLTAEEVAKQEEEEKKKRKFLEEQAEHEQFDEEMQKAMETYEKGTGKKLEIKENSTAICQKLKPEIQEASLEKESPSQLQLRYTYIHYFLCYICFFFFHPCNKVIKNLIINIGILMMNKLMKKNLKRKKRIFQFHQRNEL